MIDTDALWQLFNDLPGDGRALYIDTFATACWMHKQRQKQASIKLLKDLLTRINRLNANQYTDLLNDVVATLDGNEERYALSVPLRSEFRQLFKH